MRLVLIFLVTFVVVFFIAVHFLKTKKVSNTVLLPSRKMEGVEDVNSENYDDVVGHDRYVLIEFYADWCGHCRVFSPTYAKFAKYVQHRPDLVSRLIVAKVNSPENVRIEQRYKIEGYPTVLLVPPHSHTWVEFQHSRDVNGLTQFVEEQLA
ncbi:hypothetical protein ABB37_00852 [Leptomonas pyrrhocoris]|uniref:Thioredoxin domain-containing protein n=1 Tax=Leptomonas pyrrhocoris TaxID=157538 RepID=A0A0N0E0S3_LEPPY|nr:hypothetical protein ABB37_00852 [Leptomonas pyrrhocoris]KPA86785.1 hypothetical protein ABB37_00852 [Leptomonas pyrrhocoris]|eukprot:XP_015665224.1 hypothetical protein ABB37_00852 [Leptomonas pyrrhocoris]